MRTHFILLFIVVVFPTTPVHAAPMFTITDLGVFGRDIDTSGQAIDEAGNVVGGRFSPQTNGRALRWNTDGTITTFEPPPGYDHTGANDINASGQIIGTITQGGFFAHLWNPDGTEQTLNIPNSSTNPNAINDKVQVVGVYDTDKTGQHDHAFLWQNNSYIDLGTLGGRQSTAYSINNAGVVVGGAEGPNLNTHAFTWQDTNLNGKSDPGEMVQLPDLGLSSAAYHIDDQGLIAGFVLRPDFTQQPTLWKNGVAIPLPMYPGDINASAWVTGPNGWTAGNSMSIASSRAVLWADGTVYLLDDLIPPDSGWSKLQFAFDMNSSGQIVGYGFHPNDFTKHAFLLTPVPGSTPPAAPLPPAVWVGSALAAAIMIRRRSPRVT